MRDKSILDGVWDFSYYGETVPEFPMVFSEFMPVPGCFDLMEPYCGKRGFAAYRRWVYCGGLVRLCIEGLGITAKVYWNRKLLGECKYTYMPEEFVFEAGDEGRHELVIVIDNHFDQQFHPSFDFYGYGGIYGSVVIERLPHCRFEGIFISTEDYTQGKVRVRATAAEGYCGEAALIFDSAEARIVRFENGKLDLMLEVPGFRLWSPDSPNLHTLTLRTETDALTETFGIREFHTKGQQIFLNGQALKFFGYNRHESHPELGAATPVALMASDLRLLKEQGGNFIRGSHYPQRRSFLELCDRMGVLVWEETMSWGINAPELHSRGFLDSQREQADKLTRASFNHPCIAIRGFLNENDSSLTETRSVVKTLYDTIRAVDEHCLISFASNRYEKDLCTDLVDVVAMNPYPGWYDSTFDDISTVDKVIPRLRELSNALPRNKPYLVTEIGCEALIGFRDPLKARWTEDYQAQVLAEVCKYVFSGEECAGVAIWLFADTRSFVNGPSIYSRARGFNNKGVLDEHRRPKWSWEVIRGYLQAWHQSKKTGNMKTAFSQVSRNCFTLIEVLVVIAIIIVLAGMLLSTLNSAKEKARSITCKNNLKSLGTAHQFYMNDFDYCFMGTSVKNTFYPGLADSQTYWHDIALCYVVKSYKTFLCPGDFNGVEVIKWKGTVGQYIIDASFCSYGFNYEGFSINRRGEGALDEKERIKSSLVKNPSKLFTIMDSASCSTPTQGYYSIRAAAPSSTNYIGMPNLLRHSGQVNVVFADSHAETLVSKRSYYLFPWNDDNAIGSRGAASRRLANWTYDGRP